MKAYFFPIIAGYSIGGAGVATAVFIIGVGVVLALRWYRISLRSKEAD